MTTNADIVRSASNAMVRGDVLALMGHLASDVRWHVHSAEAGAAPWFGIYRGKPGVVQFLQDIAVVAPVEVTDLALVAQGDLVVTWIHVRFCGPDGRATDMDEAHFWRLVDGRIVAVDILVDTAAVAAHFG